ncbi:hypothetical protein AADZ90_007125 [Aestuariibius sp. 2305UL40-4]|uniref:hypothetical protein n=1 Tax=Aestuariibius violaceus TaxID=3234132 RepID=UPI00345E35AC
MSGELAYRRSDILSAELIHLIYDTAIDNSLWPEMVLRIYDAFEEESETEPASESLRDLQVHFAKGLQISERILKLQERGDLQDRLLDNVALRVEMFGHDGNSLGMLGRGDQSGSPPAVEADIDAGMLVLDAERARELGLPPKVASVQIGFAQARDGIAANIARELSLTPSRQKLLSGFLRHANLRRAAEDQGLSYETARTYFKDICEHAGVSGQAELLRMVLLNPALLLRARHGRPREGDVRRLIDCPGGGQIEIFQLGREDAYPIVHYDALSGGALDLLGHPERYLPILTDPVIRARSKAMLEERIAQGMDGLVQEYQIVAQPLDVDVSELRVPFQLFHGVCDQINPLKGARALAETVERSQLVEVPDCGHAFIYAEWD